jgi:hypothetical protein
VRARRSLPPVDEPDVNYESMYGVRQEASHLPAMAVRVLP